MRSVSYLLRVRKSSSLVASSLLFLALGSMHTSYGPAIPTLRERFDLAEEVAGLLPSSHFVGAVLGIGAAMVLSTRISVRSSLRLFGLSLFLGGTGLVVSAGWGTMLMGAGLVGIGSGGLQVEVVAWLGRHFRNKARRVLNSVHAFLSLGFVLGPIGVAASPTSTPFIGLFLIVAAGILALLSLMRSTGSELTRIGDGQAEKRFRPPLGVLLMALVFALYVGLEIGIGTWEPTHLVASGVTPTRAATLTALFWGGFSLSRILAGYVPERIDDRAILLSGLSGAAVALLSAYPIGSLVLAYALAGVALGPVFPAGLTWVSRRYALSTSATGVLLLGSMTGGILFPPLMGSIIGARGTDVLPLMMAILALSCCAVLLLGMKRGVAPQREGW